MSNKKEAILKQIQQLLNNQLTQQNDEGDSEPHQGSQISTGVINTYKFYCNMYVKYPRFS